MEIQDLYAVNCETFLKKRKDDLLNKMEKNYSKW